MQALDQIIGVTVGQKQVQVAVIVVIEEFQPQPLISRVAMPTPVSRALSSRVSS